MKNPVVIEYENKEFMWSDYLTTVVTESGWKVVPLNVEWKHKPKQPILSNHRTEVLCEMIRDWNKHEKSLAQHELDWFESRSINKNEIVSG